jgi:hypothetical protein
MLVKNQLYGDVSEKPMMGMIYPFSIGTLTFIKTIEMLVESLGHCTWMIHSSGSFLLFWWGWLGWVASSSHLINKLNKAILKRSKFRYLNPWQALKTSLNRILAIGELRTWLCLNGRNRRYGYQKRMFEYASESWLNFFQKLYLDPSKSHPSCGLKTWPNNCNPIFP